MRRLKDLFKVVVWQAGLSYLALWGIAFWTLDEGPRVYGGSGVCHPDAAKVLFYWVCEPSSALAILATLSNVALTATVWAPVYVAAATVRPDAMAIAIPIVGVHLIGLPTALFIAIRLILAVFAVRRLLPGGSRGETPSGTGTFDRLAPAGAVPAASNQFVDRPETVKPIKQRIAFGLRERSRA